MSASSKVTFSIFLMMMAVSSMAVGVATHGQQQQQQHVRHLQGGEHQQEQQVSSRQAIVDDPSADFDLAGLDPSAAGLDPLTAAAVPMSYGSPGTSAGLGAGSLTNGPLGYGVFKRTGAGLTLFYLGLGEEAALYSGVEDAPTGTATGTPGGLGLGLGAGNLGSGLPWTFPATSGLVNNNFGIGAGFYRPYQLVVQFWGARGFQGGYYRNQRGFIVPLRGYGPYLGHLRSLRYLRRPFNIYG